MFDIGTCDVTGIITSDRYLNTCYGDETSRLCVSRLNNACSLVNCFVWGFFYCSASVTDCTAKPSLLFCQCHRLYSKPSLLFCQCHRLYSKHFYYSSSVTDCTANIFYCSASVTDCTANLFLYKGHFEISRPLESKKNQLLNQNPHVAISSTFSIIPAVSPHSYCTD